MLLILTLIRLGGTTDMLLVCDRGRNHLDSRCQTSHIRRTLHGSSCRPGTGMTRICALPCAGAAVARQTAGCRDREIAQQKQTIQAAASDPSHQIKSNLSIRPSPTPTPRAGFAARSVCLGLRLRASPLPCRARLLYSEVKRKADANPMCALACTAACVA